MVYLLAATLIHLIIEFRNLDILYADAQLCHTDLMMFSIISHIKYFILSDDHRLIL